MTLTIKSNRTHQFTCSLPEEALEDEDPARSATMEDTATPPPPFAPPPPTAAPPTEVTADDEDAPRPDSADPELRE